MNAECGKCRLAEITLHSSLSTDVIALAYSRPTSAADNLLYQRTAR